MKLDDAIDYFKLNRRIKMRLWHKDLIEHLPYQQLIGQHRECCALRGKGWGKKHSVVGYVFNHNYLTLVNYHITVIKRLIQEFKVDVNKLWLYNNYRGEELGLMELNELPNTTVKDLMGYPEHDDEYLLSCLNNLKNKGIDLFDKFPSLIEKMVYGIDWPI